MSTVEHPGGWEEALSNGERTLAKEKWPGCEHRGLPKPKKWEEWPWGPEAGKTPTSNWGSLAMGSGLKGIKRPLVGGAGWLRSANCFYKP